MSFPSWAKVFRACFGMNVTCDTSKKITWFRVWHAAKILGIVLRSEKGPKTVFWRSNRVRGEEREKEGEGGR
jgi:hypothetical protein